MMRGLTVGAGSSFLGAFTTFSAFAYETQELIREVQVALAASTLVEGIAHHEQLDLLIAGDDVEAKRKVSQLVSDGRSTSDRSPAPSSYRACRRGSPLAERGSSALSPPRMP